MSEPGIPVSRDEDEIARIVVEAANREPPSR
jgi:hypothetical protein